MQKSVWDGENENLGKYGVDSRLLGHFSAIRSSQLVGVLFRRILAPALMQSFGIRKCPTNFGRPGFIGCTDHYGSPAICALTEGWMKKTTLVNTCDYTQDAPYA